MAGDSAVIVKTRKFKKNPLLARKQVCLILNRDDVMTISTHIFGLHQSCNDITYFFL